MHFRKLQLDIEVPKRVHITGQHRPTMSTRRNDREQPKTRDRKGQETIPAHCKTRSTKQTERTTTVRQIQLSPFVLKQSLVKLKALDLQLRANWIPGNFLQFHLTNSLAKCRFTTGQKQKFLSRTACVMQKRSKFKFHMSIRHSGSPSWFSPSSDCT